MAEMENIITVPHPRSRMHNIRTNGHVSDKTIEQANHAIDELLIFAIGHAKLVADCEPEVYVSWRLKILEDKAK